MEESLLKILLGGVKLREQVSFDEMLEQFDNGIYLIKFDQTTLPNWAGTLTSYSQVVITKQSSANVFIEIMEGDVNLKHFRVIYSRSSSSIKSVYEYPVQKLTI
jgi:hypothetical protein